MPNITQQSAERKTGTKRYTDVIDILMRWRGQQGLLVTQDPPADQIPASGHPAHHPFG